MLKPRLPLVQLAAVVALLGAHDKDRKKKNSHEFAQKIIDSKMKCRWCGAEIGLENFDTMIDEECSRNPG